MLSFQLHFSPEYGTSLFVLKNIHIASVTNVGTSPTEKIEEIKSKQEHARTCKQMQEKACRLNQD